MIRQQTLVGSGASDASSAPAASQTTSLRPLQLGHGFGPFQGIWSKRTKAELFDQWPNDILKCLIFTNFLYSFLKKLFNKVDSKNKTNRFEKKIVNLEVDDCSAFCDRIGVFGADPRLQAFSYEVSERIKRI